MSADGFADLSTAWMFVERAADNSLTRCGLFPVFSSCCIAPTTISSLIPSVSILLSPSRAGDGGGDSSTALFGFSSLILIVVVLGGLMSPVGDAEPCERLLFFDGGSSPSTTVLGGEGCDCVLERLGTVIPSSDSESDFRLVLYGIAGFDCLDADMMVVMTAVDVMYQQRYVLTASDVPPKNNIAGQTRMLAQLAS